LTQYSTCGKSDDNSELRPSCVGRTTCDPNLVIVTLRSCEDEGEGVYIIEREKWSLFRVKNPRSSVRVTPMYICMFQMLLLVACADIGAIRYVSLSTIMLLTFFFIFYLTDR
ncbi:hypothetical protein V8G54_023479, partial [Vigna mungo]